MKTLKQLMSESDYTNPKSPGDKAFVDKHIVQKTDAPHTPKGGSNDEIFSGSKQKKKKRIADPEDGDDKKVYEDKMSKDEISKKEQIVKGMKKNSADFIKRYGKDAESVMHATATKNAQEAVAIDTWDLEASHEEIQLLKDIHETLNDTNRDEFISRLETPEGLKKMIEFATNLAEE